MVRLSPVAIRATTNTDFPALRSQEYLRRVAPSGPYPARVNEDIDDLDLPQMAPVSLSHWSDDRPGTAMVHLGPPGSGISILGTVEQLRRLLDGALEALTSPADDRQSDP